MKRTVYDAEGKAHEVEAVDALEYIASGSYFSAPPQAVAVVESPAPAPEPAPPAAAPPKRGRPPKQHPTE